MLDVLYGYFGNGLLENGAASPYKTVPRGPVRLRLGDTEIWEIETRDGRGSGMIGQFLME